MISINIVFFLSLSVNEKKKEREKLNIHQNNN